MLVTFKYYTSAWEKVNSLHLFIIIYHRDYDREQFADNQIPLLVIGTKLDQIHENKCHEVLTRTAFLAEDFNAEEINLVCIFTNACLFYYQEKAKPKTSQITYSEKKLYIWIRHLGFNPNSSEDWSHTNYEMGTASLCADLLQCLDFVLM